MGFVGVSEITLNHDQSVTLQGMLFDVDERRSENIEGSWKLVPRYSYRMFSHSSEGNNEPPLFGPDSWLAGSSLRFSTCFLCPHASLKVQYQNTCC